PDNRAIGGLYYERIVFAGVSQLVVNADGDSSLVAVKSAQGAGRVGIGNRGPYVFHGESHGRQARGIDAYANGWLLRSGNRDIRDARNLRQTLGDDAVGGIVDRAWVHGLGCERQYENRRCGKIGFAECRQRRQIGRQIAERRVERGLYVARGSLNAAA